MLVDATGRAIGTSVGFYSGVYPQLLTAEGVILTFDNDPSTNAAIPLLAGLYYQDDRCAGTPYANSSGLPIQSAVLGADASDARLADLSAVRAASQIQSGQHETERRLHRLDDERDRLRGRAAGTVPNVVKPLSVVATG